MCVYIRFIPMLSFPPLFHYIGVWRGGSSRSKPRGLRQLSALQVFGKRRKCPCHSEDVLRFGRPEEYLPALKSAYVAYALRAARGGLEIASILSGKSDEPPSTAPWEARIRLAQSGAPSISDRDAGVLDGVMKVAGLAPPKHRTAAFLRRVSMFRLQRWTLRLDVELRTKLAEFLGGSNCSLEEWVAKPPDGVWNFDLSRKGLRPCSPERGLCVPGKTRRESPECPARKKRALLASAEPRSLRAG